MQRFRISFKKPIIPVVDVASGQLKLREAASELLLRHTAGGLLVVVPEAILEVDAAGLAEQRHAVHRVSKDLHVLLAHLVVLEPKPRQSLPVRARGPTVCSDHSRSFGNGRHENRIETRLKFFKRIYYDALVFPM